jgi:hypothetical protein
MYVPVTSDQLKVRGRYFVREGNETYFGTFLGMQGDHIRLHGGNVTSVHLSNMFFHANRYFSVTMYKYVSLLKYQWEQYWVDQILRDITGDETFTYSILP